MALTIKRKSDSRVIKCILHRVADIPGGVTVKTSNLGGSALYEGTPLAVGDDGMYKVVKTVRIITAADATATTYEVAKGSHFQVGDYFATDACAGQAITAIDTSDTSKDVITVSTTLGAAIEAGTTAFESDGNTTNLAATPVGVAGQNSDVVKNSNLFSDIWLIAVINETNAPAVNDAIKAAMPTVVYIKKD